MTPTATFQVRLHSPGTQSLWELLGPDGLPLPDVERFLNTLRLRGLSPRTARAYAFDLLCAYRWMHQARIQPRQLRAPQLLEFIEFQRRPPPAAASTINRRLHVLHSFLAFLGHPSEPVPSWALSNPPWQSGRGVRSGSLRVKEPQRLVQPLPDRQFLEFFASLRTWRDRSIALLMWAEGLRSFEILGLDLDDVDLQLRNLRILGKGNKERMMPLAEPVADILTRYLQIERPPSAPSALFVVLKAPHRGEPLTLPGLRRIFRYHRARSGILSANPHRLRHSFATNMTRLRVPLLLLAKMLGHSSPQTTMRYVQIEDHELRELYEQALEQFPLRELPHE
jgi:integrase/recombinase XerD